MNGLYSALRHYRLTADHVVELFPVNSTADLLDWAREVWGEDGDERRRVAYDELGPGLEVSTVFLGLDHGFGRGEPLVFETMIFDDYASGDCWRFATWDEAVAGHNAAVAELRGRVGSEKPRKRGLERVDTKKAPE